MPSPIPPPNAADSTGLPDSQWITDVRDALEDYPERVADTWQADGVNGVVGVNAVPIKTSKRPINDGSLSVRDNTAGTNFTVITSGTPTSTQVLANLNTGELQFLSPPANTNQIQVEYQFVKWRDAKILNGLYAGLREMFPVCGKTYTDTSIRIQVLVWDYILPIWAQDPRSRVVNIKVRDPGIPTEPYRPLQGGFDRIDLTTIHIPQSQRYSPTANLQLIGWGPYLELKDLEPQLYELPIFYALSTILPKKETFRLRQDTAIPATQEGGQQPGLLTQSGDYWLKRFEDALARMGRTPGPGWNIPIRTTYQTNAW